MPTKLPTFCALGMQYIPSQERLGEKLLTFLLASPPLKCATNMGTEIKNLGYYSFDVIHTYHTEVFIQNTK